jgi:hypothetical protein
MFRLEFINRLRYSQGSLFWFESDPKRNALAIRNLNKNNKLSSLMCNYFYKLKET